MSSTLVKYLGPGGVACETAFEISRRCAKFVWTARCLVVNGFFERVYKCGQVSCAVPRAVLSHIIDKLANAVVLRRHQRLDDEPMVQVSFGPVLRME